MPQQAVSDMGLLAPLREAQVSEARRDIELYKPLKEASVATAVRSMQRFDPLEEQVVQDALAGVQADPTRTAGRAAVDVRASFVKAREGEERKLSSMGLDPARMAWMGHSSSMQEAAGRGGRTHPRRRNRDSARRNGHASGPSGCPGFVQAGGHAWTEQLERRACRYLWRPCRPSGKSHARRSGRADRTGRRQYGHVPERPEAVRAIFPAILEGFWADVSKLGR
ncbi:hypothetical protein [Desulfocurvibacter africanus]|uniref:hypothetical protein n=1 Tax=Desulfocurvibacter africanus TaxID=873 RepID=UPI000300CBBD|nr:hypothetical protein [Desulfocurvibacter africanus]